MYSGALARRSRAARPAPASAARAGRLAAGLADVLPPTARASACSVRRGEVPIAAEREIGAVDAVPADDPTSARDALAQRRADGKDDADGRTVLAVPLCGDDESVGVARSGLAARRSATTRATPHSSTRTRRGAVAAPAVAACVTVVASPRWVSSTAGSRSITGGASGIGARDCRAVRGRRARSSASTRPEPTGRAADRRHALRGRRARRRRGDRAPSTSSPTRVGGLDVLVNNAGTGDLRPLHTVDDKLWHRLIDVNLTGTFNGMRAAMPIMLERAAAARS